jgi:hypothetical protein
VVEKPETKKIIVLPAHADANVPADQLHPENELPRFDPPRETVEAAVTVTGANGLDWFRSHALSIGKSPTSLTP